MNTTFDIASIIIFIDGLNSLVNISIYALLNNNEISIVRKCHKDSESISIEQQRVLNSKKKSCENNNTGKFRVIKSFTGSLTSPDEVEF